MGRGDVVDAVVHDRCAAPPAAILLPPAAIRIPVTFVAVIVALCLTGALSAHLGRSPKGRAILRLVTGGTLAMVVTYVIGELLDVAVT